MLAPASHIRLAEVGGDLVILDLAHDEYMSIGADAAAATIAAIGGDPCGQDEIVHELVGAGIVNPGSGNSPAFIARPQPIDCPVGHGGRLRFRELIDLCATSLLVAKVLRRGDLRHWFKAPLRPAREPLSDEELFGFAARFRTYRCLVPKTGRCLVQSMMLALMLRKRGVTCDWVFGVRTHPFEAHCWIEARGYVLNDVADHVAWYVPIAEL